jgi:hypothetical protein
MAKPTTTEKEHCAIMEICGTDAPAMESEIQAI